MRIKYRLKYFEVAFRAAIVRQRNELASTQQTPRKGWNEEYRIILLSLFFRAHCLAGDLASPLFHPSLVPWPQALKGHWERWPRPQVPWLLTWHDLSHICLDPWGKEAFTLPDTRNSVGVSVLVRICLRAVVLADPHPTGSMKLGKSYLPSICPHIPQPPCSLLMEAFPLKVPSGLFSMPFKPGQNRTEKCLTSPIPLIPNSADEVWNSSCRQRWEKQKPEYDFYSTCAILAPSVQLCLYLGLLLTLKPFVISQLSWLSGPFRPASFLLRPAAKSFTTLGSTTVLFTWFSESPFPGVLLLIALLLFGYLSYLGWTRTSCGHIPFWLHIWSFGYFLGGQSYSWFSFHSCSFCFLFLPAGIFHQGPSMCSYICMHIMGTGLSFLLIDATIWDTVQNSSCP